jgi:multidrug resistance efflux pump
MHNLMTTLKKIYKYTLILNLFLLACKPNNEAEVKPIRNDIVEVVFASGTLESDDRYNIMAQNDGNLISLKIKEGDKVQTNQIVATIDNPQNILNEKSLNEQLKIAQQNTSDKAPALKLIKANIDAAKIKFEQDEWQVKRYKELLEADATTKNELEQYELIAKTSKENLKSLQEQYNSVKSQNQQIYLQQKNAHLLSKENLYNNNIKAIVSGKVYNVYKQKGDYVRRGEIIATIANDNNLFAQLNVDENSIDKIKLGQEVVLQLNTQKNKKYKGLIDEILPQFDINTQSFIVKVKFVDKPDFTINGTQLEANIKIEEKKNALLIPRNYMYYGNKVQKKDSEELSTIQTGIISTEYIEVLEGISESDILIPIKPKK